MSQAAYARDRPKPNDKWHLDEVVIVINGVNHWLWRGFDANGDVLDILARAAAAQDKSSQALLQEADRAMASQVLWSPTSSAATPSQSGTLLNRPITGRSMGAQGLEHQDRGQPQADPKTGEDHGPLQIPSAGVTISVRP